jgi:hypothetical protein
MTGQLTKQEIQGRRYAKTGSRRVLGLGRDWSL